MDSSFFLTIVVAAIMLLVTIFFLFYRKFRFRQESITNVSSLSPSSPPSSLSPHNWKHHVFPSFHGADVRKAFLSHILKEFRSKGIDPFIDNHIERSKSIGPELIDAIRGSRIAIVLLSRNYASSTWCMNELVEIMKCREELSQIVMTIFYKVDPTDVKKQDGDFGKIFRKTCKGKSKEDIVRWRHALEEVAKIAGYHSSNWDNEAHMIEDIATDVSNKLFNSTPSRDFDGLVGMRAHMEKIEHILRPDLSEVRMIGILGPAGIGKSTIARVLYNRHSKNFQLSVFMENIKARYAITACSDNYGAKLYLQEQFMSQIIKQLGVKIPHLEIIKDRLKDKKVFVVLDDVDQLVQLEAMAKETCWFGPWSRIIITTQDQKLLRAHGINHIYRVKFPSSDEALEMFCMYAFCQKSPKDGFTRLAWEVTDLVGNLPLGLEVMGSYFKGMTEQEWSMELPMLRTRLNGKIERVLKFSYDALCDEDKDLFLHIACFFNNEEVEKVVEHLAESFLHVRLRLDILADKSLISITNYVHMHSLLAQLGKQIVRKQSVREPRGRQFLVDAQDICEVLTDSTADTRSVIGIDLPYQSNLNVSERVFEGMSNLQFLRCPPDVPGCLPLNLFPKLRLLDWQCSSMTCLPFNSNLEFLVELRMDYSELEKLWDGIKLLRNLKRISLTHSENLKKLPNISKALNLKELNLSYCSNLIELPSSIGNATNLRKLDLCGCSSLVELPSSIGNATNLRKLDLSRCSSLVNLQDSSIGNATNLQDLDLSGCSSLMKLPSSIGNATNLRKLNLSGCSSLMKLPSSIGNATNLQYLNLSRCSSLVKLPSSIGNATNLKDLDLCECSSLMKLPSSIGNATNLQYLHLCGCSSLVKLPSSIGNATNLRKLDLRGCSSLVKLPSSIGNATNLQDLNLSGCSNLVELPSSIGNATNLQYLDLSGCLTLVELPASIGNLHSLRVLDLCRCSKLEVLPTNVNLVSLIALRLDGCSLLKSFPEISTNIKNLGLIGTSIEVLPSSIRSWSNLEELLMPYSENLKEFPYTLDSITELHLSDTEIQEIGPWVKGCSRLRRLVLNEMQKLVSISELPDSLFFLDAENCVSLERLDCSFSNPKIHLKFGNCFKLNQEARNLVIQTSTSEVAVLPGGEVPANFTFRSSRNSLTVKLNEKHLRTSTKFRACIVLVNEDEIWDESIVLECRITSKQNASNFQTMKYFPDQIFSEHLYVFDVEAEEVTSTELDFVFQLKLYSGDIKNIWIKGCGILQLLEPHVDEEHQSCNETMTGEENCRRKRIQN